MHSCLKLEELKTSGTTENGALQVGNYSAECYSGEVTGHWPDA